MDKGQFEGPRAKAILAKLSPKQLEEVLKIHKAMKKIEKKDKYHFPKTEEKEGGKGEKKVKAKKTKAKKTKAKKTKAKKTKVKK